jgi:hypothetical protein
MFKIQTLLHEAYGTEGEASCADLRYSRLLGQELDPDGVICSLVTVNGNYTSYFKIRISIFRAKYIPPYILLY